jgi:hypothetical protein
MTSSFLGDVTFLRIAKFGITRHIHNKKRGGKRKEKRRGNKRKEEKTKGNEDEE